MCTGPKTAQLTVFRVYGDLPALTVGMYEPSVNMHIPFHGLPLSSIGWDIR